MAKLPKLTLGIKGPPLRHQSARSTQQVDRAPSIMPRLAAMAGIAAIWSLVTITPLIASVGLQTQVDRPPIRLENKSHAIVRMWEPPTWEAQRAKLAPQQVAVAGQPAYQLPWLADRWPEAAWDTQRVRQTPIPDRHDPPAYSFPLLVDRWPQPEWPSQTSLKSPIPDRHDSAPFARPLLVNTWPQPDWETQQTRKTPIPNAVVVSVPPFSRASALPIALWPQPEWDSQRTRLSPIPDRHDPAAWSNATAQPITQWEPTTWTLPPTRFTPIPDVVVAGDQPPVRVLNQATSDRWNDTVIPPLPQRRAVLTPSGPEIVSQQAFTRQSASPIAQWSDLTWDSQATRKTPIPDVHDAPPFGQRLWLMPVVALWEPGPPDPIVRRVVGTPSAALTPNLHRLFIDVETGDIYYRLNATTPLILRVG